MITFLYLTPFFVVEPFATAAEATCEPHRFRNGELTDGAGTGEISEISDVVASFSRETIPRIGIYGIKDLADIGCSAHLLDGRLLRFLAEITRLITRMQLRKGLFGDGESNFPYSGPRDCGY